MIYSTVNLVQRAGVCDDGAAETQRVLEAEGLSRDDKLSAIWCLDRLGLHNTIFSLGNVLPRSKEEAQTVLQHFGYFLVNRLRDDPVVLQMQGDILEAVRLAFIYLSRCKDKPALMDRAAATLHGPPHYTNAWKMLLKHGTPLHLRILHTSLEYCKHVGSTPASWNLEIAKQTEFLRDLLESTNDAYSRK